MHICIRALTQRPTRKGAAVCQTRFGGTKRSYFGLTEYISVLWPRKGQAIAVRNEPGAQGAAQGERGLRVSVRRDGEYSIGYSATAADSVPYFCAQTGQLSRRPVFSLKGSGPGKLGFFAGGYLWLDRAALRHILRCSLAVFLVFSESARRLRRPARGGEPTAEECRCRRRASRRKQKEDDSPRTAGLAHKNLRPPTYHVIALAAKCSQPSVAPRDVGRPRISCG